MGVVSKGLKNEFETANVNEPPVFEPLKFYCTFTNALWKYCTILILDVTDGSLLFTISMRGDVKGFLKLATFPLWHLQTWKIRGWKSDCISIVI